MKAKFIMEKFTEHSDPVEDMGIGDKKYSPEDEVWVVMDSLHLYIEYVYLNKKMAERFAEHLNKEYYDILRSKNTKMNNDEFEKNLKSKNKHRYIVLTLFDAIEQIKNHIRYDYQ
jgi:hypothetical protein